MEQQGNFSTLPPHGEGRGFAQERGALAIGRRNPPRRSRIKRPALSTGIPPVGGIGGEQLRPLTHNGRPFGLRTVDGGHPQAQYNVQPRKTFGINIDHVRKAAILAGHDDDWITPDARLPAKDAHIAQGES